MDISVEVSPDNVVDETVEVVESLRVNSSVASLLAGDTHLMVTHAQDVLVPSTEASRSIRPFVRSLRNYCVVAYCDQALFPTLGADRDTVD